MLNILNKEFGKIEWSNREQMRSLADFLVKREDIENLRDDYDRTALIYAAENNGISVVAALAKNPNLINQVDCDGNSALHLAIINKAYGCIWILLNDGAALDIKNDEGKTAMDLLGDGSKPFIMNKLRGIQSNADIIRIYDIKNMLMFSKSDTKSFLIEVFDVFLHNFNPDNKEETSLIGPFLEEACDDEIGRELFKCVIRNKTPLDIVCGNYTLRDLFFEYGHDLSLFEAILESGIDINSAYYKNYTPACVLAKHIYESRFNSVEDYIKVMDSFDCSTFNTLNDEDGACVVHYLAAHNAYHVLESFINKGVDINIKTTKKAYFEANQTPLMIAIKNHADGAVVKLIKSGCDISNVDEDGNTVAHLLAGFYTSNYDVDTYGSYKEHNTLMELYERLDNIDSKNNEGQTPLMLWGLHNMDFQGEIIDYFASKGADFDAKDNRGKTVLMYYQKATDEYHKVLAQVKNINARNKDGDTALSLALKEYYPSSAVALQLAAAGADPFGQNRKGVTAYDVAKEKIWGNGVHDMTQALVYYFEDKLRMVYEATYGKHLNFLDRNLMNEFCDWLLLDEQRIRTKADNGENVLMMAARNNCVTILWRIGKIYPALLDEQDNEGMRAIDIAKKYQYSCAILTIALLSDNKEDIKDYRYRRLKNAASCVRYLARPSFEGGVIYTDRLTLANALLETDIKNIPDSRMNMSEIIATFDKYDEVKCVDEAFNVFKNCGYSLAMTLSNNSELFDRDVRANEYETFGDYLLANYNPMYVLRWLREENIDYNEVNARGYYPLGIFAKREFKYNYIYGYVDGMQYYRDVVAQFDNTFFDELDTKGYAAIHYAARENNPFLITCLAQAGANVNIQDDSHEQSVYHTILHFETPLHIACRKGKTQSIKALFEAGADENIKSEGGILALHMLCDEGNPRDHLDVLSLFKNLDAMDDKGMTALMYAARNGYYEVYAELVRLGANVNLVDNNGNTALIYACHRVRNAEKIVKDLVSIPGIDLEQRNCDGDTALIRVLSRLGRDSASEQMARELARILVEAGAKCDVTNNNGASAMLLMSERGFSEVIEIAMSRQ